MHPNRIRKIRTSRNLSQEEFAELVGSTPTSVHRWETGQTEPMPIFFARLKELEEENLAAAR